MRRTPDTAPRARPGPHGPASDAHPTRAPQRAPVRRPRARTAHPSRSAEVAQHRRGRPAGSPPAAPYHRPQHLAPHPPAAPYQRRQHPAPHPPAAPYQRRQHPAPHPPAAVSRPCPASRAADRSRDTASRRRRRQRRTADTYLSTRSIPSPLPAEDDPTMTAGGISHSLPQYAHARRSRPPAVGPVRRGRRRPSAGEGRR